MNLASYNFYNFASNESLKEKAVSTLPHLLSASGPAARRASTARKTST